MLKQILDERGISVYKLSQGTGIAYSTLNDLVIEKTDIQNTSAATLYRLAKYLDITMELLYEGNDAIVNRFHLYNEGRNIILETPSGRVQYLGPKNLLCFHRINKIFDNVVYVDCCFEDEKGTIYHEEDYIDLTDVLSEYDTTILTRQYSLELGRGSTSKKEQLIDRALMVSDNIALLYYMDVNIPDYCIQAVSLARPQTNAIIRVKDLQVISSNMSETLLKRAVEAVKRNIEEIQDEIEEEKQYA